MGSQVAGQTLTKLEMNFQYFPKICMILRFNMTLLCAHFLVLAFEHHMNGIWMADAE